MSANERISSFAELWSRLAPHVRRAIVRHRSSDAALDADDLLQEVRIRVWTVYEGDRKSRFRTSYYYRVVNSAIVDSLRAHRGTLAHATREEDDAPESAVERVGSPEQAPDAVAEDDIRRGRLLAALERLPNARRRAVQLFLQGFTVPEIAELLGCDPGRAHNLTYRGIRALKKDMNDRHG